MFCYEMLHDVVTCCGLSCYLILCYVMLGYALFGVMVLIGVHFLKDFRRCSCYVMFCCDMSCHVMLCYVTLCYAMLCYVMLGYVLFDVMVLLGIHVLKDVRKSSCYVICYAMIC